MGMVSSQEIRAIRTAVNEAKLAPMLLKAGKIEALAERIIEWAESVEVRMQKIEAEGVSDGV